MSKIEEIAEQILEPIVLELGVVVVDVEYKKEGKDWTLRIFIDKEGGVGIDDCENISRPFSEEIDRTDPIKDPYLLEVSSPGLDRQLKKEKEFNYYMGREVDVKMYKAIDGNKQFTGILAGYEHPVVSIKVGNDVITFDKKEAVYIKLAIKF